MESHESVIMRATRGSNSFNLKDPHPPAPGDVYCRIATSYGHASYATRRPVRYRRRAPAQIKGINNNKGE